MLGWVIKAKYGSASGVDGEIADGVAKLSSDLWRSVIRGEGLYICRMRAADDVRRTALSV